MGLVWERTLSSENLMKQSQIGKGFSPNTYVGEEDVPALDYPVPWSLSEE
jgi:hypothetical protein